MSNFRRFGQYSRMRLTKWKSWSSLPRKLSRLDHPCTTLPVKLCFLEKALTLETFPRGDYKKLCELLVFYLGYVPGFHCLQQKQGIVTAVQTNVFNVADKRLPKLPQTTCLPSSLSSTSGIITQGSGRLCLPAFSAISGICLSIWFCWLLLMMT